MTITLLPLFDPPREDANPTVFGTRRMAPSCLFW
jgi:hypothetical protein